MRQLRPQPLAGIGCPSLPPPRPVPRARPLAHPPSRTHTAPPPFPPLLQGPYHLMTAFPSKAIEDESQTLQDANLLNAVIIQKK